MNEEKIKILWETVSKKYNVGDYESFKTKLNDPAKRKTLYDTIGKEYKLGSYTDFQNKIGVTKSAASTSKTNSPKTNVTPINSIADPTLDFENKKGYSNYGFTNVNPLVSQQELDAFAGMSEEQKREYAKYLYDQKYLPTVVDLPIPLQISAGDFNFNSENPYPSLMVAAGIISPEQKKQLYTTENGTTLRNYQVSPENKQAIIDAYNKDPQKFLDAFDAEKKRSLAGSRGASSNKIAEWNERVDEVRKHANKYIGATSLNQPAATSTGTPVTGSGSTAATTSSTGFGGKYQVGEIGKGANKFKVIRSTRSEKEFDTQRYDDKYGTFVIDKKDKKGNIIETIPLDMNDFYSRQAGLLESYPTGIEQFKKDVVSRNAETRKKAVGWFQQAHSDLEQQVKGLDPNIKEHFNDQPERLPDGTKNPHGKDSKFGIWTFMAPAYQYQPELEAEAETEVEPASKSEPDIKAEHLDDYDLPDYAPWWLQDQIGVFGAAADLFRIKKYSPWQATPDVDFVDVNLYDPTRELAANAEAANMAMQTAQAFTNPQQAIAASLAAQAQAAKANADVLGRYNTMNVETINKRNIINSNIYNQASVNKAQNATQLYDKYITLNQQFDNSRNQARQNLRQKYIDAVTNRQMTANLNTIYPQFAVDPSTGGGMYFRDPRRFKPTPPNTKDLTAAYKKALAIPNTSSDVAYKLALKEIGETDDDYLERARIMAALGYPTGS